MVLSLALLFACILAAAECAPCPVELNTAGSGDQPTASPTLASCAQETPGPKSTACNATEEFQTAVGSLGQGLRLLKSYSKKLRCYFVSWRSFAWGQSLFTIPPSNDLYFGCTRQCTMCMYLCIMHFKLYVLFSVDVQNDQSDQCNQNRLIVAYLLADDKANMVENFISILHGYSQLADQALLDLGEDQLEALALMQGVVDIISAVLTDYKKVVSIDL